MAPAHGPEDSGWKLVPWLEAPAARERCAVARDLALCALALVLLAGQVYEGFLGAHQAAPPPPAAQPMRAAHPPPAHRARAEASHAAPVDLTGTRARPALVLLVLLHPVSVPPVQGSRDFFAFACPRAPFLRTVPPRSGPPYGGPARTTCDGPQRPCCIRSRPAISTLSGGTESSITRPCVHADLGGFSRLSCNNRY